jgi:hypothetical protein
LRRLKAEKIKKTTFLKFSLSQNGVLNASVYEGEKYFEFPDYSEKRRFCILRGKFLPLFWHLPM